MGESNLTLTNHIKVRDNVMGQHQKSSPPEGKNKAHKRNPVAQANIMRKGGVHQISNKAKRVKDKNRLKHQLRERADRSCYHFPIQLQAAWDNT